MPRNTHHQQYALGLDEQLTDEAPLFHESPNVRTVWIYTLCEPDTRAPRYIGQTTRPSTRLRNHIADAISGKVRPKKIDGWIVSLLMRDTHPLMMGVLATPGAIANNVERATILIGADMGFDLLNEYLGHKPRYFPVNKEWCEAIRTRLQLLADPAQAEQALVPFKPFQPTASNPGSFAASAAWAASRAHDPRRALTRGEIAILHLLTSHGLTVTELAARTTGSPEGTRRLLRRLELRGLITGDRETNCYGHATLAAARLTDLGLQVASENANNAATMLSSVRNTIEGLLASFSAQERHRLLSEMLAQDNTSV